MVHPQVRSFFHKVLADVRGNVSDTLQVRLEYLIKHINFLRGETPRLETFLSTCDKRGISPRKAETSNIHTEI